MHYYIFSHLALKVAFQQSSYAANEGTGSVEVCLVIEAGGVDTEKVVGVETSASLSAVTAIQGICTYSYCMV